MKLIFSFGILFLISSVSADYRSVALSLEKHTEVLISKTEKSLTDLKLHSATAPLTAHLEHELALVKFLDKILKGQLSDVEHKFELKPVETLKTEIQDLEHLITHEIVIIQDIVSLTEKSSDHLDQNSLLSRVTNVDGETLYLRRNINLQMGIGNLLYVEVENVHKLRNVIQDNAQNQTKLKLADLELTRHEKSLQVLMPIVMVAIAEQEIARARQDLQTRHDKLFDSAAVKLKVDKIELLIKKIRSKPFPIELDEMKLKIDVIDLQNLINIRASPGF